MKPRRTQSLLILLFAGLGLVTGVVAIRSLAAPSSGSSDIDRSFRVKLELLVDGAVVTAEGVQRYVLDYLGGDGNGSGLRYETNVFGDAILADLGPSRPAVVVLMRYRREQSYDQVFAGCVAQGRPILDLVRMMQEFSNSCEVPFEFVPTLVRIDNRFDAGSILPLVTPAPRAELFPGVVFKRLVLITTTDPLTQGIADRLPFLKQGDSENVYGLPTGQSPNGLPLSSDAFFREAFR